jgi:hypothetical protein
MGGMIAELSVPAQQLPWQQDCQAGRQTYSSGRLLIQLWGLQHSFTFIATRAERTAVVVLAAMLTTCTGQITDIGALRNGGVSACSVSSLCS